MIEDFLTQFVAEVEKAAGNDEEAEDTPHLSVVQNITDGSSDPS